MAAPGLVDEKSLYLGNPRLQLQTHPAPNGKPTKIGQKDRAFRPGVHDR